MPTQRQHGGAPIVPINIVAPALAGLNTEAGSTLLGPEWATTLKNAVFDAGGRIATRKGWVSGTGTPVAGIVMRVHEYIKADATAEILFSTDADIFTGVEAPSSVEGTLGITEGNIKFCNFNDKCIALGTGTSSNPSVYTGTGNFTTITVNSGTAPTSGVGTAAFGRLWVVDQDGSTIRYSALLDETRWATADGGGLIDMNNVWPAGEDIVMAIEEFAGDLIIFGRNNIVIATDGAGDNLGIDPSALYVSDTIPGMGIVSQFALERAVGDLFFISSSGLQSLNRAMQGKTTPTNNVSRNVQSSFLAYLDQESDDNDITLTYSPREDILLAVFPSSNKIVVFDTRQTMQDGTYRSSEWVVDLQTCTYQTNDRTLRGSITGTVGEIMTYSGYSDDGSAYDFSYESGWLDLGEELQGYLKFIKKMTAFVFIQGSTTIVFSMKYDFNSNSLSIPITATTASTGSEFNVSEFTNSAAGIGYVDPSASTLVESQFGGGVLLRTISVPGKGGGQYIKVGVTLNTSQAQFALQQINLFAKVGRIAT